MAPLKQGFALGELLSRVWVVGVYGCYDRVRGRCQGQLPEVVTSVRER